MFGSLIPPSIVTANSYSAFLCSRNFPCILIPSIRKGFPVVPEPSPESIEKLCMQFRIDSHTSILYGIFFQRTKSRIIVIYFSQNTKRNRHNNFIRPNIPLFFTMSEDKSYFTLTILFNFYQP